MLEGSRAFHVWCCLWEQRNIFRLICCDSQVLPLNNQLFHDGLEHQAFVAFKLQSEAAPFGTTIFEFC